MEKFYLNGVWNISGGKYNTTGKVPGSVYSALLENGLMEDPFYRDNEAKALAIMDDEFTFSREFSYEKKSDSVILVCEGIDTLCDLYINGKFLAHTDNMHRTFRFEVANLLKDGKNEIKAVFPPYDKYIKEKHKERQISTGTFSMVGFSYVRKASYMSGWDWGPMLPDAGIWKDIYLIDGTLPRITDVRILQKHEGGKVFLSVAPQTDKPADVEITVTAPNGKAVKIDCGVYTEIENPELWWPNGYGKQPLYTVTVKAFKGGKEVDENVKRIGLRTLVVSREKDEWGEEFCYKVNGVKIFAMGADYIPEDNILARLSRERSEKLLKQAIFANFNSIRVWGGGFYPEDYFFDLCDELGIIIFMDMMFACSAYPFDEEFNKNALAEVEENLIRIRHHACIGVISGNNEIEEEAAFPNWWTNEEKIGYFEFFERRVPDIAERVCPEISFISSSPTSHGMMIEAQNETMGDNHYWQVWHGNLPFTEYRNHFFRFLSEFGFQSFPSAKTIESYTLPEDRNPFSRIMELHQRNMAANGKILNYLSQTYLYPTDFNTLVYASQLLQAQAIKYGVEHLRRNRGRCMGTLYWQLNDCWPVASWSSVDGGGRLKALHYEAKRFYSPVMISCEETAEYSTRKDVTVERYYGYETKAKLFVCNESMADVSGTVKWTLYTASGKELEKGSAPLSVKALSYNSLDEIDFNKTDIYNNYLSYSFEVGGKVVSYGSVIFTKPKHFNFVDPKIELKVNGDEITVKAEAYAKYVFISNENDDMILSDNFFDMDKGERKVKIISGKPDKLKVMTVYDIK